MNTSQLSLSTQKRIKVRPALIADDDDEDNKDDTVETIREKSIQKDKSSTTPQELDEMISRDHLETKKQIEDLRKEYGDGWLRTQGATKVQNVMGIQASAPKSNELFGLNSHAETTEEMLEKYFDRKISESKHDNRTSTPIPESDGTLSSDVSHTYLELTLKIFNNSFFFFCRLFKRQNRRKMNLKVFRTTTRHQQKVKRKKHNMNQRQMIRCI